MNSFAINERQLIDAVIHGEPSAIRLLYDRYIGILTAVCMRYIINSEDVKDVLQDSFLKILSSMARFEYRGEGSLKAWMIRVVVNESISFLRQKERLELLVPDDALPDQMEEEEPEDGDVPPDVIMELIRRLPPGYRTVFNLYVFEHKSHKEIAQLLHIKENSSASQFFRAREILAKGILDYKQKNHG